MKKDTRIIIGICIVLVLAAGFLFAQQQKGAGGVENELVEIKKQKDVVGNGNGSVTSIVQDSKKQENNETAECAVYVSGAVRRPGLYRYYGTARVSDAVASAGGFKKSADKEAINLARVLTDGEQICVLTKKETASRAKSIDKDSRALGTEAQETELVNINKASLEELMSLPGIGQAKAALIIDYRTKQGAFSKKEDLMKISGIKEGVYSKVKDFISV